MARHSQAGGWKAAALVAAAWVGSAMAADILQTTTFTQCGNKAADIKVQKVDIQYNNDNKTVTFNVAGTSTKQQNVTAFLSVKAYGQSIYNNSFDPCVASTFVQQLCPVPAGSFGAKGTQAIPAQFAGLVPSIAFQIPDIAAMATLELKAKDGGASVACIQSQVSNGKTASTPAVPYIAAGIAGAALVLSGVSGIGAAVAGSGGALGGSSASAGTGTVSPSFGEVIGWFQTMAMTGMYSVQYPQVYRSFSKNFAFSTGLIPWTQLQTSIDNFRASTGGNLTENSVAFLQNATLIFDDGSLDSSSTNATARVKRAFDMFVALSPRQITTTINETAPDATSGEQPNNIQVAVKGIQAYANQLAIPSANTFMTVLLIVAIIIAAIAVGILLVKVILEAWALFGNFPKSLTGFRKHYWGTIARAVTSLILLLYGIWVLYCVFQFTHGDSWAAKTLAGVTLFIFTAILAFFSYKIWSTARKLKQNEGDATGLYEDKSIWVKYSLFYDSYKKDYWWIFVPTIIYMFAKGAALAAGDGHGMAQTISVLIIEAVLLILLLWSRPFERKSGNVINIMIQVVRVLSVCCILVFVEQFGIEQTTQTVAGVVLIAVQSALTGILAILIIWNACIICCKVNPHRKRRKELEKAREDTLTPLDARNSLLLDRGKQPTDAFNIGNTGPISNVPAPNTHARAMSNERPVSAMSEKYLGYEPAHQRSYSPSPTPAPLNVNTYAAPARQPMGGQYRPLTPQSPYGSPPGSQGGYLNDSNGLLGNAAGMGGRQPTLPDLGGYGQAQGGYGGGGGGMGGYSNQYRY